MRPSKSSTAKIEPTIEKTETIEPQKNSVNTLYQELQTTLRSYLPATAIHDIERAFHFADKHHQGQYRRSGEPYIVHPIAVSQILASMKMDPPSIMAAILHDLIEDTSITKHELEQKFDPTTAALVEGVTKLTQIKFDTRAERQAANLRKMILAMTQDIRVIMIKLADRLHNMQTLGPLKPEQKKRIAKETLEIYAPIAHRLGINDFRIQFEDLAFQTMYPMRHRALQSALHRARGNRKEIMSNIITSIEERLKQEDIEANVFGREKHLYGLYKKMQTKAATFSDIMDVYAVRIIVDSVDICYRTLGSIHNLYKPILGRFKDYIAIPKANGYQSLHTTLFGPYGVPIEIQIRTEEMERNAANGIAAHWLYKSGESPSSKAENSVQSWLKSLLELQYSAGNSLEFIESVKMDLFPDEVYVFTPKGEIMELPRGSTVIDFAYAVHTDVGNRCTGAKINKRRVPLNTVLKNGQTIEVISGTNQTPNPAWLNFVYTGKARTNIRHTLKHQQQSESIDLGKRLLKKALEGLTLPFDEEVIKKLNLLANDLGINDAESLLAAVGHGKRSAILVARQLAQYTYHESTTVSEESTEKSKPRPLMIKGTEGMAINYARCCHPIPGDSIIGFTGIGQGLVIHIDSCRNISDDFHHHPEKYIPVQWEKKISGEYEALLRIDLHHQQGSLARLATTIANTEGNISFIHTEGVDGRFTHIKLALLVKDRVHLANIIRRIRNLKDVHHIHRSR